MAYPTTIDSFTTHVNGDVIDPAYDNAQQVALVALETKVGVNGSADNTSHEYKVANITGGDQAIGASQTVTVTNKKLSDSTTTIVANADTTKGFRFSIGGTTGIIGFIATAFTTAKTLTLPDATDTLVGKATTDTLTNKKLSDSTTTIVANADTTKGLSFSIAGTTGIIGFLATAFTTAKTLTLPDITDTIVTRTNTETLTNKTLTTPTITKPVMNATNPTAQTYSPSVGGTATLDLSLGNQHDITMPAGNITIALSNDTNNQIFTISILQDGTGSRTVTWFSTIRWASGTVPTLTTTASKRDVFVFKRTGSGTYDGFIVGQNV